MMLFVVPEFAQPHSILAKNLLRQVQFSHVFRDPAAQTARLADARTLAMRALLDCQKKAWCVGCAFTYIAFATLLLFWFMVSYEGQ